MVLVDLQWIKGTQFFADNGDPLAAGTINIYDATTTSLRTTYSNYLGTVANTLNASNQIVLSAAGRLTESVYIPTGLWKVLIKDSGGSTVFTEDNIEGALDTDALAITEALPNTPVISKTTDYTIVNADQGKIINANPTGGSFVLTLPSASTVGDGWRVTIRHVGTANQVTIAGVSSQTINSAASRALGAQYESLCLVSDGANWHIDGHALGINYGVVPWLLVESRTLTTPPASPTPGARYILAASGTPTGAWASYSNGDVAESDGQGGWIRLQPVEGWHAYDKNANQDVLFTTAWEGLPSTDSPAESDLGMLVVVDEQASGTGGGTNTASAWTKRALNLQKKNSITGSSFDNANDQITLPTGKYYVIAHASFHQTAQTKIRFKSTSTATILVGHPFAISSEGGIASASGFIEVTAATEIFELQYWTTAVTATNGLGLGVTGSEVNTHAQITVIDLASLQGPQGDQGAVGPEGFAGFKYTFSTTTSMADPGAGIIRFNNATLSSVTAIAIDDTSAATGNPDISNEILSWDDSSSAAKGKIKISKVGAAQNYAIYRLDTLTDNSGWTQLNVTYVGHAGSFSNTDSVAIEFIEKGDKGDAGSTGPTGSTTFNFDSATADADPGSGELRLNNATPASATTVYIDNNNRGGSDVSTWLDSLDDNGASTNRGTLVIADATNPSTVFHIYKVTGSVVDGTGYRKVAIATLGGAGSFTNGNELLVSFFPSGATGAIGGSTGASDNRALRSDGVGGTTLQDSAVVIDDSGNVSGIANLTRTGFDTFSEQAAPSAPSANTVAIYPKSDGRFYEKDDAGSERGLSPVGKQTIWVPAGAMVSRTTNGAAAGTAEMTTNKNMFKTLDFDTTTQEFAQFEIHMPKSWNLSTLTFQPVWSHGSTTTNFGVVWGLAAVARSDDDAGDVAFGTAQTSTDTGGTTNDIYIGPESSAITVAGTPASGDTVQFQINRTVADAGDTMAIDARLHGIRLFFTTNAATDV